MLGVLTRRVEDLVEALGIASLSRSEVSRICGLLIPASMPRARMPAVARSVSYGRNGQIFVVV